MKGIPDFTLVCGVDEYHLKQLTLTWPTWRKHKPSLLEHPMVVFRDSEDESLTEDKIREVVNHPDLTVLAWPPEPTIYTGTAQDKWTSPQRYKMLSGFVYVSILIDTPYMLKLDTDVVATGMDDWIDKAWFRGKPHIISHPWAFTKPKDQMLTLDRWVKDCMGKLPEFKNTEPLNMVPHPEKDRLGHKRIISWCSFWRVTFLRMCTSMASRTCGRYKMPVPSQDGYLWYCAKRMGKNIVRANMKSRGWSQWHTMGNVVRHSQEAMSDEPNQT